MPAERPTYGLSKQALRDAAKLLALGKAAGVKRVTIYGAVFDFPRPQQDLPAERQFAGNAKGDSSLGEPAQHGTVAACYGVQGERCEQRAAPSARRQRSIRRHQEHQERMDRLQDFLQPKRQQLLSRVWAAWKQSRIAAATTVNSQIIEPGLDARMIESRVRADKRVRDRPSKHGKHAYDSDDTDGDVFSQRQMQQMPLPPSPPPLPPPQLPPPTAAIGAAQPPQLPPSPRGVTPCPQRRFWRNFFLLFTMEYF